MKNYQQLAMRTNAPTVGTYGNVPNDLIHAVLGLMDEAEEFERASNDTNAKEEIGDMMWFVALAAASLNIDLMWDDLPPPENSAIFFSEIGAIAGLVKKPYAYGPDKPLPVEQIGQHLRTIVGIAVSVCDDCGWNFPDILEANIIKLRTRFPEKFNADQAWNRNTEAEAMAIEQAGINEAVAVMDSIDGRSPVQVESKSELLHFVKYSEEWATAQTKEQRDQLLIEYENKYPIVDTRMVNGSIYVVAGWDSKSESSISCGNKIVSDWNNGEE